MAYEINRKQIEADILALCKKYNITDHCFFGITPSDKPGKQGSVMIGFTKSPWFDSFVKICLDLFRASITGAVVVESDIPGEAFIN